MTKEKITREEMTSDKITREKAIILMHVTALLWGVAGVIGASVSVHSTVLTTGRSFFALLFVILWHGFSKVYDVFKLDRRELAVLFLTGLFLGVHWIFFFHSISKGSVAIALVTYATSPVIIALGEIMLGWSKPKPIVVGAAILSCVGIFSIHPIYSLDDLTNLGFVYGMLSAVCICVMALIGKSLLGRNVDAIALTIGQLVGASIVSLPFAISHFSGLISIRDLSLILALGLFCSAIGQSLFNKALVVISVSTGSIIASMEAPYGVVLAFILIGEKLSYGVVAGVLLVTISAILVSLPNQKKQTV